MNDFIPPNLYGIIGNPLGHTLSPVLHSTAFTLLGIPGILLPWQLPAEKLPAFVEAVRILNIKGVAVTIPHKQAIMPLLDKISDRAHAVGAVNLLYWEGTLLVGDNTDVLGFAAPLTAIGLRHSARALLLGAGGAARAAVVGLHSIGIDDITVADIAPDLAEMLANAFNLGTIAWDKRNAVEADIVVNATPLGMKGKFVGETPYPASWFSKSAGLAYDIVYTPQETRFLREAAEAGWQTVSGLDMFLGQADQQFFTWTGQHLPEEARQIVVKQLQNS